MTERIIIKFIEVLPQIIEALPPLVLALYVIYKNIKGIKKDHSDGHTE